MSSSMVHQNQNDGVCDDVNDMLQNMNTGDNNNASVCANCGKEGSSDEIKNTCNKCKQVKYCNAACKKKHRHKHKKDCEEHVRLATERAAELHNEELFKQPPPQNEDCPICFLRLPTLRTGRKYQTCCGKRICSGCSFAPVYDNQGNVVAKKVCAFCRTPTPKSIKEAVEREKKRVDLGDPIAIHNLGNYYRKGMHGFRQDHVKALEQYHRAAELGDAGAYSNIGYCYMYGEGVEVDQEKANHYFELAAISGDNTARFNLGNAELNGDNMDRALKHHMIAIRGGFSESLKVVKEMYTNGDATKEDYTEALRTYQEYLGEIESAQRDKAAAAYAQYCYYELGA